MEKRLQNSGIRKVLAVGLALVLTFAMSSSAFAASKISSKEAVNKALDNANLTKSKVTALEAEYDDGKYEIEFIKKSNGAEYSFEYSKTGKLLEKSVDYNRTPNYGEKKLSKADAKAKVISFGGFKKATLKDASVILDEDDGQVIYNVYFSTSTYNYEYEVHAATGKVLEYSKERISW